MVNYSEKINQHFENPETLLKGQRFFRNEVNDPQRIKNRLRPPDKKPSTKKDKTESKNFNPDPFLDFKKNKNTIDFKIQQQSNKRPPI